MNEHFRCTCGYETVSEENAIRHATVWHASEEERQNSDRLRARIRTMIYSTDRPFSFDLEQ